MSNISILHKCSFSCSVFGLLQSGGSTLSEKQIGATSAQLLSQWNPPVEPHGQISCTDIRNIIWSSTSQMQTLSFPRPGNGLPNCLGQEFISKFICAGGQHTVQAFRVCIHSRLPLSSTSWPCLCQKHYIEISGGWFPNLLSASWNDPRKCNYASMEGTCQEGCNWWSARCLPKHAMTATVYKEPQRARKSGSLVEEHPKFRCVCVCVRRSKHCQGVVLHPQFNDPSLMRLICNG